MLQAVHTGLSVIQCGSFHVWRHHVLSLVGLQLRDEAGHRLTCSLHPFLSHFRGLTLLCEGCELETLS